MKKLRYAIRGMSCAACVSHVERAAKKVCGEGNVSVSLLTNSLTVSVDDSTDNDRITESLKKEIGAAGYTLLSDIPKDSVENDRKSDRRKIKKFIISVFLTALLMYVSMGHMVGLPLPSFVSESKFVFAFLQLIITLPVLILNGHFFRNGFSALFHGAPNMDSLIAIGSGASMLYGVVATVIIAVGTINGNSELVHRFAHDLYFESAAMILTLVSLGKLLEGKAKSKASEAIRKLAGMLPKTAEVIREGKIINLEISQINVGDIVIVREGETIPVDGVVTEGEGSVDESALSGESMPVSKIPGSKVNAVCTLVRGSIKVKTEKTGNDTSLSRIIGLLEEAAASKAPISRLADRVSAVFVPVVMVISLVTCIVWLIAGGGIETALRNAVCVLVISCPCALGLATPTAVMVGTARGAENGILIKSASALENLHSVKYFMTDKTGTLTEGKPAVTNIIAFGCTENDVIYAAYAAESMSKHPLALAVCREAENRNMDKPEASSFRSVTGMGISVMLGDNVILVGKPSFLAQNEIDVSGTDKVMSELENGGKTSVCVSEGKRLLGIIGIADRLRDDSIRAVKKLKENGIVPVMLTGDNRKTAAAIAGKCGIDEFYPELMPEDKEKIIASYSEKGFTAMVGDGINDAPALSRADIGIAIGAGTDVAIDCADVVLQKNSLYDAVRAIGLSGAAIKCIKENLFWALIYNTICIPIAAGVLYPAFKISLSPMIAAAAMSFSSVCVVLNSLRLRKVKIFGEEINKTKIKNRKEVELEMLGKNKKTEVFQVDGMMCNNCKSHVEKALTGIKGVKSAVADLENKNVTVVCDESIDVETLKTAVINAGYKA